MILFDLKCGKGHVFEAWFRDGTAAEKQLAGRKVACPACGSTKVQKAPMAPRIGKGQRKGAPRRNKAPRPGGRGRCLMSKEMAAMSAKLRRELGELRSKIEANCDYVGEPLRRGSAQDPLRRDGSPRHLWRDLGQRGPRAA